MKNLILLLFITILSVDCFSQKNSFSGFQYENVNQIKSDSLSKFFLELSSIPYENADIITIYDMTDKILKLDNYRNSFEIKKYDIFYQTTEEYSYSSFQKRVINDGTCKNKQKVFISYFKSNEKYNNNNYGIVIYVLILH